MTQELHRFLDHFEQLSPSEQYTAALEILRRIPAEDELHAQDLEVLAEELFESLDQEEADSEDVQSPSR